MKKFLIASLLFFAALATRSEAQTYAYQGVNRNITTVSSFCGQGNARCNIIGTGAQYHQLVWNVSGTLSACSVRVDSSADGITWNSGDILAAQTCTSNGSALSTIHAVNYVRVNVTAITLSGTASLTTNLTGYINNPGSGGGGTVTAVTASSPLSSTGGITPNITCATCVAATSITNKTTGFTILSTDNKKLFIIDSGFSGSTVTLPATPPAAGWSVQLDNTDTFAALLNPNGNNLDGNPDVINIMPNSGITIYSDGTTYYSNNGTRTQFLVSGTPITDQLDANSLSLDTDSTSGMTITDEADGEGGVFFRVDNTGSNLPYGIGLIAVAGRTTAITSSPLFSVGAATKPYWIAASLYCDSASAAATATLTITYTDPSNTVQTISSGAATCTTLGPSSFVVVNTPIAAKNGTNVTYAVAIANTPTYDVRIHAFQIGPN